MDNTLDRYNLVQPPEFLSYTEGPKVSILEGNESNYNLLKLLPQFKVKKESIKEVPKPIVTSGLKIPKQLIDWTQFANPKSTEPVTKTDYSETSFKGKEDFIYIFKPIIYNELQRQGIDSKYTNYVLAQMAHESGWGKHTSGKNNYAGLKATKTQPGTTLTTKERNKKGELYTTKAKFIDFDTIEDFTSYYISRLKNKFNAFSGGDFVVNIWRKGYFTDNLKSYRNSINSIAKWISKNS